jgi:hypothetical protein
MKKRNKTLTSISSVSCLCSATVKLFLQSDLKRKWILSCWLGFIFMSICHVLAPMQPIRTRIEECKGQSWWEASSSPENILAVIVHKASPSYSLNCWNRVFCYYWSCRFCPRALEPRNSRNTFFHLLAIVPFDTNV